jgi:hypothetical protein
MKITGAASAAAVIKQTIEKINAKRFIVEISTTSISRLGNQLASHSAQ